MSLLKNVKRERMCVDDQSTSLITHLTMLVYFSQECSIGVLRGSCFPCGKNGNCLSSVKSEKHVCMLHI